jgi:hypothetical protein
MATKSSTAEVWLPLYKIISKLPQFKHHLLTVKQGLVKGYMLENNYNEGGRVGKVLLQEIENDSSKAEVCF